MAGPTLMGPPREAVEQLLRVARQRLGMEAAFLAELTEHEQIYHATTGADADTFTVHEGGRLPKIEGYCRHVMESDAPWVIRDTSAEPRVRDLAVTGAGRFGAYLGVPVRLADGRPFGTLCCVSHRPRRDLDDGHVGVMQDPGVGPVAYGLDPVDGAPTMDVQVQRVTATRGEAFPLWAGHDVGQHRLAEDRLRLAVAREREAAEEYRRLDGLRQAFLTAVSHELRTPLTTVTGALETVCAGRVPIDQARRLLDRALVNADRLERLLEDLLDLNRFAHGALDVGREAVRVDELVRRAVDEVEVADRDVELDLAPVTAAVAPVKVERIVFDLVRNAVVHTPPGTPVRVRLAADGDGVHLVVADRGPGFPREDRDPLFQPFQQGTDVPAHRPGTGVGLALVAAFAQLHGGQVRVEDAAGGGAEVHVSLPGA